MTGWRRLRARTRWTACAATLVLVLAGVAAPALARGSGHRESHDGSPRSLQVRGPAATHDPSMVRGRDGGYYVFSTHNGIEIRHSRDRVHWRFVGEVLPHGAAWAGDYQAPPSKDAWAPDVSFHHGRYYLYYAISSFGSNHSAIGLATSPSARPGTWTDQGRVFASQPSDDYNAIDPSLTVDGRGRWWLSFGSFWGGIKMLRLDPATGKPLSASPRLYSLAQRPAPDAVEGAAIHRHGRYYYLFASYDFCCRGLDSTYKIKVGRSRSVTGPYLDEAGRPLMEDGGTTILATHGDEIGPGGESILRDGHRDLLVFHYYNRADAGTPRLGIDALGWRHGWPVATPNGGGRG
jgi:arabinan endo-1,5-alpha-L-arabinosidase